MLNDAKTAVNAPPALPGVIEPRWWTGQPALAIDRFTIDAREFAPGLSTGEANGALAAAMSRTYRETGLVHVTNTGLTDLGAMRDLARCVIRNDMHYKGGANPRGRLESSVYEVGAPLEAWLHYHHEMAYVARSTRMLGFLAYKTVPGRGHTFVSDNLKATEAIMETALGCKLKELGLCYHRNLTDREAYRGTDQIGVYNHWQQSMLTDDPDEAEATARSRGLDVEWGPNRLMKTRAYLSAFEYFEVRDMNVLFSSIADDGMWFDNWPKVRHLDYESRPLKLTFGDLSELSREEKQLFVDVYDRFGVPIRWQTGDVAVVCNFRFAHGRPAIYLDSGEARELGVIIGEAFDRVGAMPGKWR